MIRPFKLFSALMVLLGVFRLSKYEEEALRESIPKPTADAPISRIRFVEYPHRGAGGVEVSSCSWMTKSTMSPRERKGLLGDSEPDAVQRKSLTSGLCLPRDEATRSRVRLFSSADALQCLKNRTLGITGSRGLLAGLAETLGGTVRKIGSKDEELLELEGGKREKNSPVVRWICQSECDDRQSSTGWATVCSRCIKSFRKRHGNETNILVGTSPVAFGASNWNRSLIRREMVSLHKAVHPVAVLYSKSPDKKLAAYKHIVQISKERGIPYLDLYQVSKSCKWANCTTNNAFVNRWQAQLLLNLLCHQDGDSTSHPRPKTTQVSKLPTTTTRGPSTVKFLPYPHRELDVGDDAKCNWMARDPTNRKDPLVQQLLGPDIDSPDLIQSRAFTDTLCVPEHQELLSKLHIFSTSQAKACLSNITLGVTGDSYMMQFFIELAEILYGTPTNGGITNGTYRHRLLRKTAEDLLQTHEQDSAFPEVHWICLDQCFGRKQPFWKVCSDCVQRFKANYTNTVVFIGAGVHVYHTHNQSVTTTISHLHEFYRHSGNVVFASMPSYVMEKVPETYKEVTRGRQRIYWNQSVHINNFDVRYLDFFQLTMSCLFDNCTYDGGHRARYVNRWKAQLFLNTICEYSE